MMNKILNKNIKEYFQEEKEKIKNVIETLFKDAPKPSIAAIQVGNNEASTRYMRNKEKDCKEVGIDFQWYWFDENITTEDLAWEILELQKYVDGIFVQLPLPSHINESSIINMITPDKDLDGLKPQSHFNPCTPVGIINYLINGCGYNFEGKNVAIFGRSNIVGKPLAKMLTDLNATVTLCHSHTKEKWDFINTADLVVTAVGKAGFLNCYAIYKPVIDVGINFDKDGKMVGDCINTEYRDVTPVPGGVGLLTRLALLDNAVLAASKRIQS